MWLCDIVCVTQKSIVSWAGLNMMCPYVWKF